MPEKARRSRHDKSTVLNKSYHDDDDFIIGALDVLDPTDRYDLLPRNWYEHFAPINPKTGKPYHPETFRHLISELTLPRANGQPALLGSFVFDGGDGTPSNNEMMKYFRTSAGDAYMAAIGKPRLKYTRARVHDKHQLFGNLTRASLELGVRNDPNTYLEGPRHIFNHKKMGKYDPKAPFTFHLPDGRRYTPDGKPLIMGRRDTNSSRLLIFEHDRRTEGISPASNPDERTTLDEKFEKIILVWKHKLHEQKYGHRAPLLLFETVSEVSAKNIADYLFHRFGPLPHVLLKGYPELRKLKATIPVTTKAYDTPWLRPGCPPYSLKTFSEELGFKK